MAKQPIKTLKVAVIGGGNVGTFLSAAALDNNNINLTIIDRDEERLAKIVSNGVGYKAGKDVNLTEVNIPSERISTANSLSGINPEIVIIATKGYDLTPEIYDQEIAPFLTKGTNVILPQNSLPNPEIVKKIKSSKCNPIILVVNAGFKLDKETGITATNKNLSQIKLPYGHVDSANNEISISQIGELFAGNPNVLITPSEKIMDDLYEKTQYACIGAYSAVVAFLSDSIHPTDEKFTFGDLSNAVKDNPKIGINIEAIREEVSRISGLELLNNEALTKRLETNAKIENSLMADARNGKPLETDIVNNVLEREFYSSSKAPALTALSKSLDIIEKDKWNLNTNAINQIKDIYNQLQPKSSPSKAATESKGAAAEICLLGS